MIVKFAVGDVTNDGRPAIMAGLRAVAVLMVAGMGPMGCNVHAGNLGNADPNFETLSQYSTIQQ